MADGKSFNWQSRVLFKDANTTQSLNDFKGLLSLLISTVKGFPKNIYIFEESFNSKINLMSNLFSGLEFSNNYHRINEDTCNIQSLLKFTTFTSKCELITSSFFDESLL